jgi:hypothetical protein
MIFENPSDIFMAYIGLCVFVVTIEWTWNKIVNRLNGAVNVLATEPAIPPQNSCFAASTVLCSIRPVFTPITPRGDEDEEESSADGDDDIVSFVVVFFSQLEEHTLNVSVLDSRSTT